MVAEVFASQVGMGWTIKFWYDAHRAKGVIGYALFFIIFALALEKLVFDRLARRAFKWRPQLGAYELAEERLRRSRQARRFRPRRRRDQGRASR